MDRHKDHMEFFATIENAKEIYDYVNLNDDDMKCYYYFGILLKIDKYINIENTSIITNKLITKFKDYIKYTKNKHDFFKPKLTRNIENLNTIIQNVNDNINDIYIKKYIDYKEIQNEADDALVIIRNKLEISKAKAKAEAEVAKTEAKYTQYAE